MRSMAYLEARAGSGLQCDYFFAVVYRDQLESAWMKVIVGANHDSFSSAA